MPNDQRQLQRRQFLSLVGFSAAGLWLTPRLAFGEEEISPVTIIMRAAATAKINITKLRGNISVLEGSGGNVAVLTGSDGKLLVDAGITASRAAMTEALASLGKEPVKHLINSHWHFDHTDGNKWISSSGVEITAHENAPKRMAVSTRVEDWNYTFPPWPKSALPTNVFSDEKTMHANGTTLALKYYGPCHTDSDISVHFTEPDILHVADSWWNGYYPFIDYSTGGSIDNTIRCAALNVERVNDRTIVIPGHGPIGNKAQLVEFRDMLIAIRDKVAGLKKAGRSVNEAIAAKPTANYDAKWGGFVIGPAKFVSLVYKGV